MYVCVCMCAYARAQTMSLQKQPPYSSRVRSRFDKTAAPITTQEIHVDAAADLLYPTLDEPRGNYVSELVRYLRERSAISRANHGTIFSTGDSSFPFHDLSKRSWFPAKEKILGSFPFSPEERQPRFGTDFEFSRRQSSRDDTGSRASIPSRLCRLYKIITDPKMFLKFPRRPRVPLFMQLNQTQRWTLSYPRFAVITATT